MAHVIMASCLHVAEIIEKFPTWVQFFKHFTFMLILFSLRHGMRIFSLGLNVVVHLVVDDIVCDLDMTNLNILITIRSF